jgi:hypothetical protein
MDWTISSWQSAQASSRFLREGWAIIPLCALALSGASPSPLWQVVHPICPCSESRKSWDTFTFSWGANGVTEPPQPAPEVMADFFGFSWDKFEMSFFSSQWQSMHP